MNIFTTLALVCLTLVRPQLLPAPVSMEPKEGTFTFTQTTAVYVAPSVAKTSSNGAAYLQDRIANATGKKLPVAKKQTSGPCIAFLPAKDAGLPAEGYLLNVSPAEITIESNTQEGFFYGVQTLLQLMPAQVYNTVTPNSYQLKWDLPCVAIRDYPRFAHRGFMLDVSRHFYTTEYIKQFIDWLALHKMNVFHWHLADDNGWRVEIKKYPKLTTVGAWRGPGEALPAMYSHPNERYGGFYTQEEIKDIVAYAQARQVEIIPEIDLPGHSSAVVKSYPEIFCDLEGQTQFSAQGLVNNVWCASKESNYTMLENIIKEMAQLFPSKYFHIGGDEVVVTQWSDCTHCKAFMKEKGMKDPQELQHYFTHRLQNICAKYGKTIIGWDEIMSGGELDNNAVVLAWRGKQIIKEAAAKQLQVIAMPAQYCYYDMKQSPTEHGLKWAAITNVERAYSFNPLENLTQEEATYVKGVQAALWSEILGYPERIAEYQIFPRLCAIAEIGWTPQEERQWEDFNTRLSQSHFERLYQMGIAFRIAMPKVNYVNGYICAQGEYPWIPIRYTTNGEAPTYTSPLYQGPIQTAHPEKYLFATFYNNHIKSQTCEVKLPYPRTLAPQTKVTTNVNLHQRSSVASLEDNNPNTYVTAIGKLTEDKYVEYTFKEPVTATAIRVATGVPTVGIDVAFFAHVEVCYNGSQFERVPEEWVRGACTFTPKAPVKAVKLVFDKGNETLLTYVQDLTIFCL